METKTHSFACNKNGGEIQITLNEAMSFQGTNFTWEDQGLFVWRGCTDFIRYLCNNSDVVDELFDRADAVVEIGGGTGLLSIFLDKINTKGVQIIMTDGAQGSVELARKNAAQNHCSGNIHCERVLWGDSADIDRLMDVHGLSGSTAVVGIAADIIWDDDSIPNILSTVDKLGCVYFLLAFHARSDYLRERTMELLSLNHVVKTIYCGDDKQSVFRLHRKY